MTRSLSGSWIVAAVLIALIAAAFALPVLGGRSRAEPGTRAASTDPMDVDITPTPTPKDVILPMYSESAFDITPLSSARIAELAKGLTPEEAKVLLNSGTEAPFCGNLLDNHKDGFYACRLCGLPLFSSGHKFDSGTGWPSFFAPFDKKHVAYIEDKAHGMTRIEIECARCSGHLGHVFEDGPKPTGLRYCLNSASLKFYEKGEATPPESTPIKTEVAYFAGGCFWGTEDRFQQTPGVISAVSGYMGGHTKNPTYEDVCTHETGHAETVAITYDPSKVTYGALLKAFFKYHDPTQLDRQGPDIGDSYRSAIFASTPEHLAQAKAFIAEQGKKKRFQSKPIVTELVGPDKSGPFYKAEEYHQDYHAKHGGHCAMPPKVDDDE